MKIAIIGTHSTGKTTIASCVGEMLVDHGFEAHYVPEFARLCPHPINESTTEKAQSWILENQMLHEYILDQDDSIIICDRATIDNFAYMHRALDGKRVEGYEQLAVDHMATYDYIFKTTMLDIDPVFDKVRSTDGPFRKDIDLIIHHLLNKHNIKFEALPATADITSHAKHILQTLLVPIRVPEQQQVAFA